MLKTRREEINVAKKMNKSFSRKMIPLFEIITEKYEKRYKIDPITNDYIYEQHGKRKMRKEEEPTDKDIITLDFLNDIVANKIVFIDYFRFNIKKYGNKIDISKIELAWKLSNNEALYMERIRAISKYSNMIPVVSIKDGFDMNKKVLDVFLQELQRENVSVALRITEEWIHDYSGIIKNTLRSTDYLLFDICEQNPKSKFIELDEINEIESKAKVILLNSPRKNSVKNGEYDIHGVTSLINNCAKNMAAKYQLEGYGDYCGLKDNLPSNDGSNGMGAALVLLYDYKCNGFYSYLNSDTSQGVQGYKKLIPIILGDRAILDSDGKCPAIKKIENMEGPGNWSTWHNINITRYIYQVYKYNKK